MKIQSIKGMHDIFVPEIKIWQQIEKTAHEIFQGAGFSELRTPVLEEELLFIRGIGDGTDIVEKEIYAFEDRNGKKLALRPEGTASIVRAYVEHFAERSPEHKRFYYMGPMFRYERPQKGRYRQFYQIGAEIFAAEHPFVDAELIHLADCLFKTLKLQDVLLEINSLGCPTCRPFFRKTLVEFLEPVKLELCTECQTRIVKNPLRVLDCKKETCKTLTQDAPSPLETLCEPCLSHFEGVQRGLNRFKTAYQVNPRLVRGLDYYQRTTFEFSNKTLGSQNAIAGGGRYDGLVEALGGPKTAGVGFAIGVERLASLVPEKLTDKHKKTKIFLACLGATAQEIGLEFLSPLRAEGFEASMETESSSLKSLLRQADRISADFVLILGENELNSGLIQIKPMQGGLAQEVPIAALIAYFQALKLK